jgi:hypothetical protein
MDTGHDARVDLFARAIRHMAYMPEPERPQLIVAYLDESKKLNDAGNNVVFAGGVARAQDWDAFNREWSAALSGKSGPIKMSHALAMNEEFYNWRGREDEFHEFLFGLAVLIHEAPIVKVASIMLAGDFESLPASQQGRLKDPQYCGFETCASVDTQNRTSVDT